MGHFDEKKKILCFGDSNTYGVIPEKEASPYPSDRYDENTRWPCVMQKTLGIDQWDIIEEGSADGQPCTKYQVKIIVCQTPIFCPVF